MEDDDILKAELQQAIAECEELRAENAQLKARLGDSPKPAPTTIVPSATSQTPKTRLPKTLNANSPADQKVIDSAACFGDAKMSARFDGKERTGELVTHRRAFETGSSRITLGLALAELAVISKPKLKN
jgi:hypothetical protein